MSTATPTPRTDAVELECGELEHPHDYYKMGDHARQLERELAQAHLAISMQKTVVELTQDALARMTESRDDAVDKLEQERAKVAKLRAALETLACEEWRDDDDAILGRARVQARQALRETEDKPHA